MILRQNNIGAPDLPNPATARPESCSNPVSRRPPPELLSPAGTWECARAAVENGADAIYFGLERFNARIRAQNFTEAALPELMEYLHRRGVRGYVSFNTLIFENELAAAQQQLRSIIAAGVDAVIVQDLGICRLIRRLSPDFPIHASTQMTITSAAGVEVARQLGCSLVVLARECTLKEIEQIQETMARNAQLSGPAPVPLEVFIHGALCVAYSGQCLTSEALGGRSANRGECAQACRMPYELIADGHRVPLGDRRYLLSPQDLAGLELLPELVRAGVVSLKIEGRLKSPEYVANVTRVYREAVDKICAESSAGEAERPSRLASELRRRASYDLEMAFSRGLYTGWLKGINNQQLVHGRFGKKRGVYLGPVKRVHADYVVVELQNPLKPGDGIVFDAGAPEAPEQGGRLYWIQRQGKDSILRFGRGDIDFRRVQVGHRLWKTSDPDLDRSLRQTFTGPTPKFQRPVTMEVHGTAGQPLTLIVRDELGNVVQKTSALPLVPAQNQPLTLDRLRDQLGRLGGTPFQLQTLDNRLEGAVLLPVSELNRLRRQCIADLQSARARPRRWNLNETAPSAPAPRHAPQPPAPLGQAVELVVLVRTLAQLEAALQSGVTTFYCDFDDPKKYREAVARVRNQSQRQTEIFVAPPRIFKMGEEWTLKQVRSCDADGYLVRNYDHLVFFDKDRRVGDCSLNVANSLTAEFLIRRFGLERVTASYDLNAEQLEALLAGAPPQWFEITIHQHMPMFHMEHCLFCAFLSTGTDYTNCGRPCDKHQLQLADRAGVLHPVKADAGCRNTVFNGLAQTGAEHVRTFLQRGARRFRVEFVHEPAEQVPETIRVYRQLIRGEISGTQLWRQLKVLNQLGVTRGQM